MADMEAQLATTSPSMKPQSRVILWTAMRCCSSAFERSIRELQGVKSLYEPHLTSFYYGPERQNEFLTDEDLLSNSLHTYDYTDQILLADYEGCNAVFAKEMAFYIPKERFARYIEGDFVNFKHSFLIRDPRKSILSEWKAIVRSGLDYTSTRDASGSGVKGHVKLYELLDFIRSTGREVTVIDAADLLKNPEYIMQVYCRQTGLPYDKKMLTWTPGEVEDWATKNKRFYKEWHWNAMYSSGFGKLAPPRDTSQLPSIPEIIPAIVKEDIQKSIPYYEAMHKFCVKVDP